MIILSVLVVAVIIIFVVGTLVVKHSYYSINNPSNLEITVVQLSDLHGRTRFINGSISKLVNKIQPDYVMITGDLTSNKKQLGRVLEELRQIECRNIYFVPGNYEREGVEKFRKTLYSNEEYEATIHSLQLQGIAALVNSGTAIDVDNKKLFIYGFDNSIYGNEHVTIRDADWQTYDFVILLAHSPSIIRVVEGNQLPYHLLLVGHTHGGQVRLFGRTIGAYKGFHVGLKKLAGQQHFYINRGLGTVKIPIRFACPPEIAVFQIRK